MDIPFDVFIPARLASSRLPDKLLRDICGRSMICRVVDRAFLSGAQRVIVAYDDKRIEAEVKKHTDAIVCKTSFDHSCGTDRIAEAVAKLKLPGDRIVVNVQGDEPLIQGQLIDQTAARLFASNDAKVATAATPFLTKESFRDPNSVKCVVDQHSNAIYFSRACIPHSRSAQNSVSLHLKHIGIYAYRVEYLKIHSRRDVCELERAESLEQLRVLYYGDKIAVHIDKGYQASGVDTENDLTRVRKIIQNKNKEIVKQDGQE